MKKSFKIVIGAITLLYLVLFISYESGYYEHLNQEKSILTEEMILKYEEDLANGVDVTKEDYIVERNNYSNIYTETSLKIASKIENTIDSVIKLFFKKINDVVNQ